MSTPLSNDTGIETTSNRFGSLLGELCLRAFGLSLIIAAAVAVCLAVVGGSTWGNTS